jgi:hypothetical protein
MKAKLNAYTILVGKAERYQFEDIGTDGRILKLILKN